MCRMNNGVDLDNSQLIFFSLNGTIVFDGVKNVSSCKISTK